MKKMRFRWHIIIIIAIFAVLLSIISKNRIRVETDITESLPRNDRVIADAKTVISSLPMKDRLVIDLGLNKKDSDALVDGAVFIENKLRDSGLFKNVGLAQYEHLMPDILSHIMKNLPVLFTPEELDRKVRPLLEQKNIRETLQNSFNALLSLDGVGQANFISNDPLGLKNIILSKLATIAPSANVIIYRGHLVSSDERHLLILAEPVSSGTNTEFARTLSSLMDKINSDLDKAYRPRGYSFTMTPVGSYRAALDNEDAAKGDVRMCVIFATIGIAILLLAGFPRPFIGLLALLPAILGSIAALFVYSFIFDSISLLAIGFSSTIISFTVDYGIAYLLFLDRPYETHGLDATKEVWSLGLLAMLTSAIGFAFLFISDFRALAEIGYYTALGVVFTYIFVHLLFPLIFPVVPPAKKEKIFLQKFVNKLMSSDSKWKLPAAVIFFLFMMIFAKTNFSVDFSSMNTVREETRRAEQLVTSTWGNIYSKIYLMSSGNRIEELQDKGDALTGMIEDEIEKNAISSAFIPSMIFPGERRMRENLAAWQKFWKPRVLPFKKSIASISKEIGFSPDAFIPFYNIINKKDFKPVSIPEKYFSIFGIYKRDKNYSQFSVLTPGKSYNALDFYNKISSNDNTRVFDPAFFADRLGQSIFSGFVRMALIVGIITILVALVYLFDLTLAGIALAPTVFSLVCTFGSMKLLGIQPGIPSIVVIVIVIGMGTDYALYLVRAYQRYMDESHPSFKLIRMTIFLSAMSTMIGFGVLSLAKHSLLKSAGFTLLLGVGYSFIGTILIVPPLLRKKIIPAVCTDEIFPAGSKRHIKNVLRRYRFMEPLPRLRAFLKSRFDPALPEIVRFVKKSDTILDLNADYGIHAAWLLEAVEGSSAFCVEHDEKKSRFAALSIGDRGSVYNLKIGEFPGIPQKADTVLMLDLIHKMSDDELIAVLKNTRKNITKNGLVIINTIIPDEDKFKFLDRLIFKFMNLFRDLPNLRTKEAIIEIFKKSGFKEKESRYLKNEKKLFMVFYR